MLNIIIFIMMGHWPLALTSLLALITTTTATTTTTTTTSNRASFTEKNGANYTVFEHALTGGKMEFVRNSGIYETTPGVEQYSGYLSIGRGKNIWFW